MLVPICHAPEIERDERMPRIADKEEADRLLVWIDSPL